MRSGRTEGITVGRTGQYVFCIIRTQQAWYRRRVWADGQVDLSVAEGNPIGPLGTARTFNEFVDTTWEGLPEGMLDELIAEIMTARLRAEI